MHKSQLLSYMPTMNKHIWNEKHNINTQNEILRYKSNKIYVRFMWRKIQNVMKDNKKDLKKKKEMVCVHG